MKRCHHTLSLALALVLGLPLLSAQTIVPGTTQTYTYRSEADRSDQPFRVYIPNGFDPAQPHPVVIYLHGFGGRFTEAPTSEMRDWADQKQWLLAFADGRGSIGYEHQGEIDVLRVRSFLLGSAFNGDPTRVYLQGHSMGGHGTYRIATRYPDLFAAANPMAGWTDHRQFVDQYYDPVSSPNAPNFFDPLLLPLYLHSAPLTQAENGSMLAWRIYYGTNDGVNPAINATRFITALKAAKLPDHQLQAIAHNNGHARDALHNAYTFFEGKQTDLNRNNVVFTTSRLRQNRAYWVQIDAFTERERHGRIAASIDSSNARVEIACTNVERFTLDPSTMLLATNRPCQIFVDQTLAFEGLFPGSLTLRQTRDSEGFATGWTTSAPLPDPLGVLRKKKFVEGPVADVTLGPFIVIYGATGTADETAQNLKDAQLFCGEWNGMTILRWSSSGTVPERWWDAPLDNAGVPIYPFATGFGMNATQAIRPYADTEAKLLDLQGMNLILFGDASDNLFVQDLRTAGSVLEMNADGNGIAGKHGTYSGPTIRWTFIQPRPDEPDALVMVSKGFNSSLPGLDWNPFSLSKDLEKLAWQMPDYAIWDAQRTAGSIASTWLYLPESWLEAGYFTEIWQLDTQPPSVRARFTGINAPGSTEVFLSPGSFMLEAVDGPGESGVERIEYRLNGGPWQTYLSPLPLQKKGQYTLEYRAYDRGGAWRYEPLNGTGPVRPVEALQNVSALRSISIEILSSEPPADSYLTTLLRIRMAGVNVRRQSGDRLKLRLALGRNLPPDNVLETTIALRLGNATFGPYESDQRGKFRSSTASERAAGRIAVGRKRSLRLTLKNVSLTEALNLTQDVTDSTQVVMLGLTLGGIDYGDQTLPTRFKRNRPGRAGFLRY